VEGNDVDNARAFSIFKREQEILARIHGGAIVAVRHFYGERGLTNGLAIHLQSFLIVAL
jgi:hypothetical protein